MGFQFEGYCCELKTARIFANIYSKIISGENLKELGEVEECKTSVTIKEIVAKDRMTGYGGNSCVLTQLEEINIDLKIRCQSTFNRETFLGAGKETVSGSTLGAPKSFYYYGFKPQLNTGEWVSIPLDCSFDNLATGADAFKVEGYSTPGTAIIYNDITNTITPTGTFAPLVLGTDYKLIVYPGNKIVGIQLNPASTKFANYTTFVDGAVNIKVTGKTFDSVILSPYSESSIELSLKWVGGIATPGANGAHGGGFYKCSFEPSGFDILTTNDEFNTLVVKGKVISDFDFRRKDLISKSPSTKRNNFGYVWSDTN